MATSSSHPTTSDGSDRPGSQALAGAVLTLAIDLVTAEVVRSFDQAHVPSILLKGPSIARWLYAEDGRRFYLDTDLLVPPGELKRAEAVLSALGFVSTEGGARGPSTGVCWGRPDDPDSTHKDHVDLHVTINGLGVSPYAVWATLSTNTEPIWVAGMEMRTLAPNARALHLALHAAVSGFDVPQVKEDLRRGLAQLPPAAWTGARDLALALEGLPNFSAGLRLLPDGNAVADGLGLTSNRTLEIALRSAQRPPIAVGVAMLHARPSPRAKVSFLAYKLFPARRVIRSRFPRLCRGRLGTAPGYAALWRHYLVSAPAAYRAWFRARRAQ